MHSIAFPLLNSTKSRREVKGRPEGSVRTARFGSFTRIGILTDILFDAAEVFDTEDTKGVTIVVACFVFLRSIGHPSDG